MKLPTAKRVVKKLTDAGLDASLYEGYSGRGMYGRTTAGVVVEDPGAAKTLCPRSLKSCAQDSMGMDTILY